MNGRTLRHWPITSGVPKSSLKEIGNASKRQGPLSALSYLLAIVFLIASVARGEDSGRAVLTVEQTVAWINAVLKETGSSMEWEDDYRTFRTSETMIEVPITGSLKVHYTSTTESKEESPYHEKVSSKSTFWELSQDEWMSLKESDIAIIPLSQTIWGRRLSLKHLPDPPDFNRKVLGVWFSSNNDAYLKYILLPPQQSSQEKLLKAFRHLLKQAKTEFKDPF